MENPFGTQRKSETWTGRNGRERSKKENVLSYLSYPL
jgi:hypothetical protein